MRCGVIFVRGRMLWWLGIFFWRSGRVLSVRPAKSGFQRPNLAGEGLRCDCEIKGNVKDARLKNKSRRPLQIQMQRQLQKSRRDAGATKEKGGTSATEAARRLRALCRG